MNKLLLTISCLLLIACASNPIPRNATKKLTGTWVPVKQELGGNNIARQHFSKQSLTIRDTSYKVSAENDLEEIQQDEGVIFINKNHIQWNSSVFHPH